MKLSDLVRGLRRRFVRCTADDAFAEWAITYDENDNPLIDVEQPVMAELLGDLTGAAVLDVGCGTGRLMRLARQRGARLVVGLDRCVPMIRRADGIRVVAEMTRLPFANASFDCVTAGLAIGYVAALDRFVQEAARVLRPGGRLICSDLHPRGRWLGWQRTYRRADGRSDAAPGRIHSFGDIHRALRGAEMNLIDVRGPPAEARDQAGACPAALIWLAKLR